MVVGQYDMHDALKTLGIRLSNSRIFSDLLFPKRKQILHNDSPPTTYALPILMAILRSRLKKGVSYQTIRSSALLILSHPDLSISSIKSLIEKSGTKTLEVYLRELLVGSYRDDKIEIERLQSFRFSILLLMISFRTLRRFFSSSTYIGPLRAQGQRFYRFQELEVSDILPDGSNFAMFLRSLSDSDVRHFSDWAIEIIGSDIKIDKTEGHISIELKKNGIVSNIADVGFGISQILPVLGQIWNSAIRSKPGKRDLSRSSLLAIEQPELHLHPAHQARLADIFANAIKHEHAPKLIVETHSESLIAKTGQLVAMSVIAKEDVQIIIIEPDKEAGVTARIVQFLEDGRISEWPYGFFQGS